MTKLEMAIQLGAMGFNVVPIAENAKTPIYGFTGFLERACRRPADIADLWDWTAARFGKADYNIGISTSKFWDDQALVVVDVDGKGGKRGFETIQLLDMLGHEFTQTLCSKTASGGLHMIYFVDRPVRQGTSVLGEHVDIRGKGGYIVAPGSTIDGVAYAFTNEVDQAVIRCPEWVIEKCGGYWEPPKPMLTLVKENDVDQGRAVVRAMKYLRTLPTISEGNRNNECYRIAGRLKDFGVKKETIASILADSTVFAPPLSVTELESVVRHVFSYGYNAPASDSLEAQFGIPVSEPDELGLETASAIAPHGSESAILGEKPNLVDGLLEDSGFSSLLGVPGTKKSFVALELAFCVATGRPFMGHECEPGGVLYLSLEGLGGFRRRIMGLKKHHKLDEFPLTVSGISLNLVEAKEKDGEKIVRMIERAAELTGSPTKLLVIDTLARLMGASEEGTGDMGLVIERLDYIRKRLPGLHIMVVHHMGKDVTRGSRGSTKLPGAVDTELRVGQDKIKVSKQKNMEYVPDMHFRLQSITLGHDTRGRKVTTGYLVSSSSAVQAFVKQPLIEGSKEEALLKLTVEHTTESVPSALRPAFVAAHQKACYRQVVKDKFVQVFYPASSRTTKNSAFKRALDWLLEQGYLSEQGDFLWISAEVKV